ncbi:Uncharacterised protein [Mycobacteroides abscessus subsp. abscessus]|nr:Uncharacterised protein [Mycobacteroides abscessus subsp. abscessus]
MPKRVGTFFFFRYLELVLQVSPLLEVHLDQLAVQVFQQVLKDLLESDQHEDVTLSQQAQELKCPLFLDLDDTSLFRYLQ